MRKTRRLLDVYRFAGFIPYATIHGIFGDPYAVVIPLRRRRKKRAVVSVDKSVVSITTGVPGSCATSPVAINVSTWNYRFAGSGVGSAVA
jgi:hypothetical protein